MTRIGPDEDRHPEEGHPRRPHLEDRDQEVDGAQDRARPDEHEGDDPEVLAVAGRGQRSVLGQRRVARPAGRRRATGHEPEEEQDPAERQHPERQRVDPREGHVRRADLERDDVVAEARQHRDHEQEDHERGVHREELVVGRVRQELESRRRELGPHTQGQQAADEEEHERVDDVHDPDLLVIGRRQPGVQARPVSGGGWRQRGRRHRSLLTGPSRCRSSTDAPCRRRYSCRPSAPARRRSWWPPRGRSRP